MGRGVTSERGKKKENEKKLYKSNGLELAHKLLSALHYHLAPSNDYDRPLSPTSIHCFRSRRL